MKNFGGMSRERLGGILSDIKNTRAAVVGDIALDAYWTADMRLSELSRETPHHPLPIIEERYSPGAGGNVCANLAALMPKKVSLISVIGDDWRGRELLGLFYKLNVETAGVVCDNNFITGAYIKPMRRGISGVVYEDPRLDFNSREPLSIEAEDELIRVINSRASGLDVICVCDQLPAGVITKNVRDCLIRLARQGMKIVADSRDRINFFTDMIIKPNETEAAAAVNLSGVLKNDFISIDDFEKIAKSLREKNNAGVFMTLGGRGSIYVSDENSHYIPAREINGPIDICGAGDSSISGFALALSAGASCAEAAYVAGLCGEITVQKIGVTGTASAEEILKRHSDFENV